MASRASRSSSLPSRRCGVAPHDPVGLVGRGGFFLPRIHSHAQVSRVSCIQRRTICYLGEQNHLRCGSPPVWRSRADGPNRDAQEVRWRRGCAADALSGGRIERGIHKTVGATARARASRRTPCRARRSRRAGQMVRRRQGLRIHRPRQRRGRRSHSRDGSAARRVLVHSRRRARRRRGAAARARACRCSG